MLVEKRKGFTLAELMVVILILAIIISIAVPVYITARNRAIVRAAQSRLRDATTAAKNLYSDVGVDYNNQTETQLDSEGQPIDFTISLGGTPASGTTYVMVTVATADTMTMQTRDANGNIRTATISNTGAVNIN